LSPSGDCGKENIPKLHPISGDHFSVLLDLANIFTLFSFFLWSSQYTMSFILPCQNIEDVKNDYFLTEKQHAQSWFKIVYQSSKPTLLCNGHCLVDKRTLIFQTLH